MRQDFILQPTSELDEFGNTVYDFPLADTVVGGVYQPTPYGNSDQQHIQDGILAFIGWWKQYQSYGFGLMQYFSSEYNQIIFANLKNMLSRDGYSVSQYAIVKKGKGFMIDTSKIVPVN
jgi:hypothetical protein